jgi:hypothetical protein
MSNLEHLILHLELDPVDMFVDGNNLKNNILNYMPRLKKFSFNICSVISLRNQISLFSNDDIQRTFTNFPGNRIISCVDYFPELRRNHCHIYSYPYALKYYYNITNHFPGGLLKCVRDTSLVDEHPFKHEFFVRIAQAFPLITKLTFA